MSNPDARTVIPGQMVTYHNETATPPSRPSPRAFASLEDSIYAAAYVAEFKRLHELGVHANFRADVAAGRLADSDLIMAWEEWCHDLAIDAAESMRDAHRQAVLRRRKRK